MTLPASDTRDTLLAQVWIVTDAAEIIRRPDERENPF
jgi:hypothetical protein